MTNKIINVRRMTDDEMEQVGWHTRGANPPALELDNGDILFPSSDPEGNGAGALFGITENDEHFILNPDE